MTTNIKIGFATSDELINHNFTKATITAEELEKLLEENEDKHIICLRGLTIEGDLDLADIEFKGEVRFGVATFKGAVFFGSAIFKGEVNFDEAIFKDWACFNEATFKKEVSFDGVVFEKGVHFDKATLQDKPLKEIYKLANKQLIKI